MLPNEITRLDSSGGSYLEDLLKRNFSEQEEEIVIDRDISIYDGRKRKDFDVLEEPKGKKQKTFEEDDFETIQKRESDLVQAARAGSLDIVKMLITNGANVNAQVCGCTSLMYAAFYGRELMVTFLIDNGANTNLQNLSGETALMWAVERQNWTSVEILLQRGVNTNLTDIQGKTALHKASKLGLMKFVELLVEKGNADVNQVAKGDNLDGCSALQEAAYFGKSDIVIFLVEHGARVNQQNKLGRTALHRAASKNDVDVIQTLLDNGSDIDQVDQSGKTAIHWATFYGNLNVVKVLVENGADLTKTDKAKCTCAAIAKTKQHTQILQFLNKCKP